MTEAHRFLSGKRCLVLDDEFLIALDLQDLLESAGAEVACTSNIGEVLALLRGGRRFDLAVLDVRLGDNAADSTTLATLLSEQGTPFAFVTGMRTDDPRFKQFPQAPVIEKPYQVGELVAVLREMLAGKSDENVSEHGAA